MKFLVAFCVVLAFAIQIQASFGAPIYHHKKHAMDFFLGNNFENPVEVISNEFDNGYDDESIEKRNLVLVEKTDLKKLVARENAVLENLESVLDNLPKRRNKRNDLFDILDKTWDGIEKNFKNSLPDIVANAIKGGHKIERKKFGNVLFSLLFNILK